MAENTQTPPAGERREERGASDATDRSLRILLARGRRFLVRVLDIQRDANIEGTIETIHKDMVFQGHNVWVLVCSIFIASIGLNTNSAAVIIGAMLISPLMGPILGIGLSVGMNDFDNLRRAARHFAVMMAIALATSTFYFILSPLGDAQSELLARTRPTLLDAAIAVFGGVAGIIGVSRRDRGNVIPGVAIATALMPPLCTAGYGLANLNWPFFFGAFYLFSLNSIFIALSTVGIVRYLHFPIVQQVDLVARRRMRRQTAAALTLILLPSAWVFYGVVAESLFRKRAQDFITQNIMTLPGVNIVNSRVEYGEESRIEIFLAGDSVPDMVADQLQTRMASAGLANTVLRLHEPQNLAGEMSRLSGELRVGIIQDLYERNAVALAERQQHIAQLEARLADIARDNVPIDRITRELDAQYPRQIRQLAFGRMIEARMAPDSGAAANAPATRVRMDTIPTFMLTWDGRRTPARVRAETQIAAWLKVRLALDTVRVLGN